nr:uroporphyrin-III C-methyltransferase [Cyanidiaceae sp.]
MTHNKTIKKIYIVGAGPGDPELLTLKAQRILHEADVIIHDALINPKILQHCNPNAEIIKVGKRRNDHSFSQLQIASLLVDRAEKGDRVIRLKGGDPSIFGRSGEEILELFSKNINIEIIPGITTASAVAADMKFPLTHRQLGSSITFLTGEEFNEKTTNKLKWEKIIWGADTIIIYMVLYNLSKIIKKFLSVGCSAEKSIMLVQWASLKKKKILIGTISTIINQVLESKFGPPSLAIIGEVIEISSIVQNL